MKSVFSEVGEFLLDFIDGFLPKVAYTGQFILCLVCKFADRVDLCSLQAVKCTDGQFEFVNREIPYGIFVDFILIRFCFCFSSIVFDDIGASLADADLAEVFKAADEDLGSRCYCIVCLTEPSVSSSSVSLS